VIADMPKNAGSREPEVDRDLFGNPDGNKRGRGR
jgi:hypothetical protein